MNKKKNEEPLIKGMKNKGSKVSVREAAKLLGVTPLFLRVALETKMFPFGFCLKQEEPTKKNKYYINRTLLMKYISGEIDDIRITKGN